MRPMILLLAPLLWLAALPCSAPAQGTISYVGASTQFRASNDPGGVSSVAQTRAGDFLLMIVAHNTAPITGGIDDWNVLRGGPAPDSLHILWRVADQAGIVSYGAAFDVAGNTRYILQTWRGVNTSAPFHQVVYGATVNDTVTQFPQPTVPISNSVIIRLSQAANLTADSPTVSHNCAVSISGGWFEAGDRILASREPQASPGLVAPCSLTATGLCSLTPHMLILAPATAAPPPPPSAVRRKRAPVISQRLTENRSKLGRS
jgi:hypothetical protein